MLYLSGDLRGMKCFYNIILWNFQLFILEKAQMIYDRTSNGLILCALINKRTALLKYNFQAASFCERFFVGTQFRGAALTETLKAHHVAWINLPVKKVELHFDRAVNSRRERTQNMCINKPRRAPSLSHGLWLANEINNSVRGAETPAARRLLHWGNLLGSLTRPPNTCLHATRRQSYMNTYGTLRIWEVAAAVLYGRRCVILISRLSHLTLFGVGCWHTC